MKRLALHAALVVAAFVGGFAAGSPPRNAQEVRFEGLVNGARMSRDRPVAYNHSPTSVCAHEHAVRMYREGRLRHSTDSELTGCIGSGKVIGEIVGFTSSLNEAFDAYLASASHNRIIYGPWRWTGTGVVVESGGGWWTVGQFWRPQ